MNRYQSSPGGPARPWAGRAALVTAAWMVACTGTDSGHLVNAPTALIATIGNQPTSAQGVSPVTITVRSGADVQLSGEDSDGGNISIAAFAWRQTDGPSVPAVQLLYRSASTVSFTAPSVARSTTLNFQLTVTNATGQTGTATAQVLVVPANDPNRFLTQQAVPPGVPPRPRGFRAAVSTVAGLTNLAADVPVCVQLSRTLVYSPRAGAAESGSLALPVQQVDVRWLASVGGAAGFPTDPTLSYTNPMVSFQIPELNSEDVFAVYNVPGADFDKELVPSDIESAYLKLAVTAKPGSCDGTQSGAALSASQLMLQLYDESGVAIGSPATAAGNATPVTIDSSLTNLALTPDGSSSLTPDDFLRAEAMLPATSPPTELETRESATAYYLALDPASAKTTLPEWLGANCFDPNNADYGAGESGYSVVHADYTNNFDLGFGRDMYFAACPNGDMASVVINYPSLGAAVNRVGAFLAVAMEYSAAAGSGAACFTNPADSTTNTGACFAKFYAFAPDERTGLFKRVSSVNFDRRGQKYLPGACTTCHGGAPNFTPGQPYPAAGDVDAAFMPWDAGALLYSDTDPAFPCKVSSISPVCDSIDPMLYTKAAQAPHIQQLNALAWRTYQHPEPEGPASVDRYQALRDLLTKWYGGDPGAAAAHAFDDSVTPTGWLETGQTTSSSTDLYHQVFAHYCRACHTQISAGKLIENLQMQTLKSFSAYAVPLRPGQPPLLQLAVYQTAQMPQSRLAADRFWVGTGSAPSAAQVLAQYINAIPNVSSVPMDSQHNVIGPGQPVIVTLHSGLALSETAPNTISGAQSVSLDAALDSYFVSSYQWSLCPGAPPAANGGTCAGALGLIGTPLVAPGDISGPPQPGATYPAYPVSAPGTYFLTLTAGSSLIGAAPPAPVSYEILLQ